MIHPIGNCRNIWNLKRARILIEFVKYVTEADEKLTQNKIFQRHCQKTAVNETV